MAQTIERRDDAPVVDDPMMSSERLSDVRVSEVRVRGTRTIEPAADASGPPALPDELTWSATLDPHDDTREIEITDEMVCSAIAAIEGEQVYPFRREAGTPAPVARPVVKADVIAFPGR